MAHKLVLRYILLVTLYLPEAACIVLAAMANLVAGSMRSWAVVNEYEEADNKRIELAWKEVEFKMKKDSDEGESPRVVVNPEGDTKFRDLPLQYPSQKSAVHLCDVIIDLPLPMPDISDAMAKSDYQALPAPLCPKRDVGIGYTMQVTMLESETGDSTYMILKHFHMVSAILVSKAKSDLSYGELLVITNDFCPDRLRSQRVFQYMIESMGGKGIQFLYASLQDRSSAKRKAVENPSQSRSKKEPRDLSRLEEGYAFMRGSEAPKANNRGQVNEWADIQVNDPASVLHGWCEGKVKDYLKCLIAGRQTAKRIDFWPLTLKSFKTWFLDLVLSKMIGTHQQHGTWWIGRTWCGKSNGSKTLSMTTSKHWLDKHNRPMLPGLVTAKYFDMFRGEQNTVYQPPTLDDHNCKAVTVDMLKAFLNPSEEDALLWARWGGAGFDMGSFRQVVTNPYNKKVRVAHGQSMMPHEDFVRLIEPSLPKEYDDEDLEALFRRANFIVITEYEVVYRVPSREKTHVPCIAFEKEEQVDIFVPEVREIMKAYKDGCRELPASYDADVVWSQEYLTRCMAGSKIPRSATSISCHANGSRSERPVHAVLLPPQEMAVKVKKERVHKAFLNLKNKPAVTIDISSDEGGDGLDDEAENLRELGVDMGLD
jgi:hypothetical protein